MNLFFPENLCGEPLQLRAVLPRIRREAGLETGLGEEGFAVPIPRGRHLRQQQASVAALADDEAVPSDGKFIWGYRPRLRQDTNLHLQLWCVSQGHRFEARVLESRRPGGIGDSLVEGLDRKNVTNTSTKFSLKMQGSEGPARLGQMRAGRSEVELSPAALQCSLNGVMRQPEQ